MCKGSAPRVCVWKQTIVQRLPDVPVTSRASGVTLLLRKDLIYQWLLHWRTALQRPGKPGIQRTLTGLGFRAGCFIDG